MLIIMSQPQGPQTGSPNQTQSSGNKMNRRAAILWTTIILLVGSIVLNIWATLGQQLLVLAVISSVWTVSGVLFALFQAFPSIPKILQATLRFGLRIIIFVLLLASLVTNFFLWNPL